MIRVLASLLLLLSLSVSAAESKVTYDVYLDDKLIGSHRFEFRDDGDRLLLRSEASFDVRFLFVTAFRYRHENRETWKDGCLADIDAYTDSNGKLFDIEGEQGASGFVIQDADGTRELDDCVRSFAYWNPAIRQESRLLNSQTGEYEPVSFADEGEDVLTIDGREMTTRRYRLGTARGDIFLWYTPDDRWVALDAPAKGDRRIRYQIKQLPQSFNTVLASAN